MSYLPNSIERCAPIVGFDPYAFIMDAPSNLTINKMQSPYDVDYYATGPKNAPGESEIQAPPKKKKGGAGFFGILQGAAALASVVALGILIKRGSAKIGKIFHKGAKSSTDSGKMGKIGKFFKEAGKKLKDGFESVKTFAGEKFQAIKDFFKKP